MKKITLGAESKVDIVFGLRKELAEKLEASNYKMKELKKSFPQIVEIRVVKNDKEFDQEDCTHILCVRIDIPSYKAINLDLVSKFTNVMEKVVKEFLDEIQASIILAHYAEEAELLYKLFPEYSTDGNWIKCQEEPKDEN